MPILTGALVCPTAPKLVTSPRTSAASFARDCMELQALIACASFIVSPLVWIPSCRPHKMAGRWDSSNAVGFAERRFLIWNRRQLPRASGWGTHIGVYVHVDYAGAPVLDRELDRTREVVRLRYGDTVGPAGAGPRSEVRVVSLARLPLVESRADFPAVE